MPIDSAIIVLFHYFVMSSSEFVLAKEGIVFEPEWPGVL